MRVFAWDSPRSNPVFLKPLCWRGIGLLVPIMGFRQNGESKNEGLIVYFCLYFFIYAY